jgi:ATP-binding cassette subfamily B protein
LKIPLRQYWALLKRYLRPQWPLALALAALLIADIALQLVSPQIMRRFIDLATGTSPASVAPDVPLNTRLLQTSLLFIAAAVAQQVVAVLSVYVGENVGWITTNALRADLAAHCLQLDMSFHNAHTPGEMIERVDGDVNALSTFFSQFVIQLLGNALLLVGVLALLFREDWRVGLALGGFSVVALLAMWWLRDIAVPHWEAERQANADQFGFLEERLSGTEDIRSCGARAYVMRRFFELMRTVMQKTLKAGLMVNIMINTTEILFALGTAAAFAMGAWLYYHSSISIGTVLIISWYGNMLIRPIQRISRQMQQLQRAGAGITRIQGLLRLEPQIKEAVAGQAEIGMGALAVEFADVSFGYDDALPDRAAAEGAGQPIPDAPAEERPKEIVLHDLSFRLEAGKVLGLLGRTGSGKTTMTRLLFRLYEPDQGHIQLGSDGRLVDVRQVPLVELRQRIGMVTQNIQLFHATVRDNLTFFAPGIDDAQILRVIRDLGLWEWFKSQPDGLDTELDSGGGGLSAGEAQLLAFTRIFLHDPGLVILDEASSRLDPATENLIERAVERLIEGRTAIVIAHRLRTVQRADEIMILQDGRISEYGPRAALAADPDSRFAGLLRTGLEEVLA